MQHFISGFTSHISLDAPFFGRNGFNVSLFPVSCSNLPNVSQSFHKKLTNLWTTNCLEWETMKLSTFFYDWAKTVGIGRQESWWLTIQTNLFYFLKTSVFYFTLVPTKFHIWLLNFWMRKEDKDSEGRIKLFSIRFLHNSNTKYHNLTPRHLNGNFRKFLKLEDSKDLKYQY